MAKLSSRRVLTPWVGNQALLLLVGSPDSITGVGSRAGEPRAGDLVCSTFHDAVLALSPGSLLVGTVDGTDVCQTVVPTTVPPHPIKQTQVPAKYHSCATYTTLVAILKFCPPLNIR